MEINYLDVALITMMQIHLIEPKKDFFFLTRQEENPNWYNLSDFVWKN
jgi:hypothetical protein